MLTSFPFASFEINAHNITNRQLRIGNEPLKSNSIFTEIDLALLCLALFLFQMIFFFLIKVPFGFNGVSLNNYMNIERHFDTIQLNLIGQASLPPLFFILFILKIHNYGKCFPKHSKKTLQTSWRLLSLEFIVRHLLVGILKENKTVSSDQWPTGEQSI